MVSSFEIGDSHYFPKRFREPWCPRGFVKVLRSAFSFPPLLLCVQVLCTRRLLFCTDTSTNRISTHTKKIFQTSSWGNEEPS